MKHHDFFRYVAVLFSTAALVGMPAQAEVYVEPGSDSVATDTALLNDQRHYPELSPLGQWSELNALLEPYSFQVTDFAAATTLMQRFGDQLGRLGARKAWQDIQDFQTVDVWYAPDDQASIVCISGFGPGGYSQTVYAVPGYLARGAVLLP